MTGRAGGPKFPDVSRSPQRKSDPVEPEQAQLAEALTTLVRTLVGFGLEGLSRKMDELDVALSRRIADLDERVESTLAQLRRDLAVDVATVRHEAEAASGKLGERLDASASRAEAVERAFERDMRPRLEALDRLVGDIDERLARRSREAQKIEQDLRAGHDALGERLGASEKELGEKLRSEIAKQHEAQDDLVERVQALTESVKATQKGIEQQLETSQRLSAVLNTLTSVFTTERTAAIAAATAGAAQPTRERRPGPGGTTSDTSLGDLDSVLNKLFPR